MTPGEIAATSSADGALPRPGAVTVAVVGVAIEGLALVVSAGAGVVQLVGQGSSAVGVTVFLVVGALGVAWVLGAAASALRRGSRRARGPLITAQLLQGATALAVVQVPGRPGWLAAAALAAILLAVVVVAALLTPKAVAFATR